MTKWNMHIPQGLISFESVTHCGVCLTFFWWIDRCFCGTAGSWVTHSVIPGWDSWEIIHPVVEGKVLFIRMIWFAALWMMSRLHSPVKTGTGEPQDHGPSNASMETGGWRWGGPPWVWRGGSQAVAHLAKTAWQFSTQYTAGNAVNRETLKLIMWCHERKYMTNRYVTLQSYARVKIYCKL